MGIVPGREGPVRSKQRTDARPWNIPCRLKRELDVWSVKSADVQKRATPDAERLLQYAIKGGKGTTAPTCKVLEPGQQRPSEPAAVFL